MTRHRCTLLRAYGGTHTSGAPCNLLVNGEDIDPPKRVLQSDTKSA